MSTIVTRTGKGSALTWAEADANFTNLNGDKVEKSGDTMTGALKNTASQIGTSATATDNFSFEPTTPGAMKLARGNAGATTQDIMTVDASGKVAFPQNPVQSGPAFSASVNSLKSLVSGVSTVLIAETEIFDTNNCYNTTTGTFTPNVAGYYLVSWNINFDGSSVTRQFVDAVRAGGSGALSSRSTDYNGTAVSGFTVSGNWLVYMNGTTDNITLSGYIIGTTVSYGGPSGISKFSAVFVRAV